jgi:uncharacterized membrane protein YoaK (UPF0700 family)
MSGDGVVDPEAGRNLAPERRLRARCAAPRAPAGTPRGTGGELPERVVVRLLAVLAAAAGCLDAVCVLQLGGLFASVITGNLVHLARAIAVLDGRLAIAATTAIASYALGAVAGSAGLRHSDAGWCRRTTLMAAAELALLACVAGGWLVTGGRPDARITLLLLALAAVAMGMQSILTLSSGVAGAATTYLTGPFTHLMRTLTLTPHADAATAGGAVRLAALLGGATVGALLLQVVPSWAPALPAVLVATVVVIAAASARARRGESES